VNASASDDDPTSRVASQDTAEIAKNEGGSDTTSEQEDVVDTADAADNGSTSESGSDGALDDDDLLVWSLFSTCANAFTEAYFDRKPKSFVESTCGFQGQE
jgi:hypothetical protein